jgi:hypothetical protein
MATGLKAHRTHMGALQTLHQQQAKQVLDCAERINFLEKENRQLRELPTQTRELPMYGRELPGPSREQPPQRMLPCDVPCEPTYPARAPQTDEPAPEVVKADGVLGGAGMARAAAQRAAMVPPVAQPARAFDAMSPKGSLSAACPDEHVTSVVNSEEGKLPPPPRAHIHPLPPSPARAVVVAHVAPKAVAPKAIAPVKAAAVKAAPVKALAAAAHPTRRSASASAAARAAASAPATNVRARTPLAARSLTQHNQQQHGPAAAAGGKAVLRGAAAARVAKPESPSEASPTRLTYTRSDHVVYTNPPVPVATAGAATTVGGALHPPAAAMASGPSQADAKIQKLISTCSYWASVLHEAQAQVGA